ncbi:type II toxin-antitoxin system RelE/ParE family toxin [Pleomorphovibrio marinus]|uniref:type II toxin-antitoxin system RelE/ParE family toxin n=1 Tax=Pleomorphovibrio marinus TaxID=2164132 RepID=UPI000E0C4F77|nr:type II toxin-antitoxin system RelE/ParE family toxin [Pleomorphovibrio marinus]
MTVIWSKFAESQLDDIFFYYSQKVNSEFALKIITELIKAPEKLMQTPHMGQVEELLTGRLIKYRYLICNNYKIIYSVDEEKNAIRISDVFDTRQNPSKIERSGSANL